MRTLLALPLLVLSAGTAAAHPLTDIRFDRTAAVRVSPDGVEVTYTLELSPFALHLDAARRLTPHDIAQLDRSGRDLPSTYARRVAAELAERFRLTADGTPLSPRVTHIEVTQTDHARCVFRLRAAWPPGGPQIALAVRDETFPDFPGVVNLTLDRKGGPGADVELLDLDEPPPGLRTKHSDQLTPEQLARSRSATAVVRLPVAIAPAPRESPGRRTATGVAAADSLSPAPAEPVPEPVITVDRTPAPNLLADLFARGLPALFDWNLGIGVLLLAAFLFGAAHAFTPGHGKTLVAAYLVGERGTARHAVVLALTTTLAHTGSVMAMAAILWGVYGERLPAGAHGGLQFVAGLFVIAVGAWLLLRRAAGKADHFHLFEDHHHHDHHHHHHHDHHHGRTPDTAKTTAGWVRLVLMGVGGGLVPCWDAVLLLVAASALGRLGFALPLLFAFSLGLAVVLVALGLGVVYAHRAGATRFRERRWFRLLPVISAAVLVGLGFWLCKEAVGLLSG
jgi:nickel/cobalt exporter